MSAEAKRGPALWGSTLAVSFGLIAGLRLTGAIDETTGFILLAIPTAILVPLFRSMSRRHSSEAIGSQAAMRYTKGIMLASVAYMLGLGVAVSLHDRTGLEGLSGFLIAMLPVIPIFGMIYVMGRYLVEETDEFLRQRTVIASLAGLALVLGVGSFWGFLETFGMVAHVPGWWAVPIWAVGMGIARCWLAISDRQGADQ